MANGKKRKRDNTDTAKPATTYAATSSLATSSSSSSLFLTRHDPEFEDHVQRHYRGFAHCSVDELDFHEEAKSVLERLRDANYYQYDIVMAGGKHTSRTFVKRTLVGNPGITYKYLGLRLFAHAWSGPGVSPLMRSICDMNRKMIRMTQKFENHQNCEYNLTLINYMEPTTHSSRVGFKEEANYGMGKVSVSWHADSSLELGSSIGVYHCLPTQKSSKWDWRIALRPSPESAAAKDKVKPIVVDTKDGDAYFLLGNFNETHQHCVLAGSQANRISSTHRVAVTQEDTYEYILKRVKIARKRFRGLLEKCSGKEEETLDAKVLRHCQKVLTEVETEWIAQYWLQGGQHDTMHTWWQKPMKMLEAYWRALEAASCTVVRYVLDHPESNPDSIRVLVHEFQNRRSLREQWDERRADKIYQRRIAEEYRPVARPDFNHNKDDELRLPKDLTTAIADLKALQGASTTKKTTTKAIAIVKPPSTIISADTKTEESNNPVTQPSSSNGAAGNETNPKKRRKKNKKKKKKVQNPSI